MQGFFGLDDLRLLRAIGEVGSLSGAARQLGVDHSTAFRRLGALESRVGVRLFERARDGYTPTLAGEAALVSVDRILDDLVDLERRLAGEDLRPEGIVRITTADTLLALVAPLLAELRRAHPGIRIELVVDNAFLTLTKRDADVALRPIAAPPNHLVGRRLAALATAAYAAPGYLAHRPPGRLLPEEDWIGFEDSLGHLLSADWLRRNVDGGRIVCRANSLLALREAARAGMGVAALPCYLADPDSDLRRIGGPIAEMEVSLWLLTHPDLRRVARVRTVIDFLAEALAQHRSLIEGRDSRE